MKVAIVTIIDMINYGNRLQNYAMQEILKSIGVDEIDTLIAVSAKRKIINLTKRIIQITNRKFIYKIRPYTKRERPFEKFSSTKIKERKFTTLDGKIPKRIAKQYDYFVLGSDQIWNPEFITLDVANGGLYNRFMKFARKKQRIAVAPSFGVSSLPEGWEGVIADGLKDFSALSIRETAGASIISNLTGRQAPVLLDPTMILDVEHWRKFEKEIEVDTTKPYILKYILGHQSENYRKKIQEIAIENGCEIYEMLTGDEETLLTATPDQFVYLIEHASLVCTDSFHATVFSILFNRPFMLHQREDVLGSMNSRLETLLKTLKLDYKLDQEIVDFSDCNYAQAHLIIEKERIKFKNYLKNALSGEVI